MNSQTRIGLINRVLEDIGLQAKKIIQDNLATTGTNTTGATSSSIRVENKNYILEIWGRKAFQTVERGRRPGGVPKGFYYIIKKWAEDKKIMAKGKDLNRFAYFTAKKIKEEGSRLYRNGRRKDIYTPAILFAKKEIKNIFGKFAQQIIFENIK